MKTDRALELKPCLYCTMTSSSSDWGRAGGGADIVVSECGISPEYGSTDRMFPSRESLGAVSMFTAPPLHHTLFLRMLRIKHTACMFTSLPRCFPRLDTPGVLMSNPSLLKECFIQLFGTKTMLSTGIVTTLISI